MDEAALLATIEQNLTRPKKDDELSIENEGKYDDDDDDNEDADDDNEEAEEVKP